MGYDGGYEVFIITEFSCSQYGYELIFQLGERR